MNLPFTRSPGRQCHEDCLFPEQGLPFTGNSHFVFACLFNAGFFSNTILHLVTTELPPLWNTLKWKHYYVTPYIVWVTGTWKTCDKSLHLFAPGKCILDEASLHHQTYLTPLPCGGSYRTSSLMYRPILVMQHYFNFWYSNSMLACLD